MKKIFIMVMVIILLALVGGYWAYTQLTAGRQRLQNTPSILDTNQQERGVAGQTSTSTTTPANYNPDTQTPKESTETISTLIKREDDNQKCTFTTSLPNPYDGNKTYTYSGAVYVYGEKVRIDHNTALPHIDGISTERHVIFDGKYSFIWSKNFQLKVDILKFFPQVSRKVDNDKFLDPVDLTRVYTFTCKTLPPDERSMFSPPADIVFQELSK